MVEFRDLKLYNRRSVALEFPERHMDDKHEYSGEDKRFLKKMSD